MTTYANHQYCPVCGQSLVLLSSQNAKLCPSCGLELEWPLDDEKDSIFGDRLSVFDPYSSN